MKNKKSFIILGTIALLGFLYVGLSSNGFSVNDFAFYIIHDTVNYLNIEHCVKIDHNKRPYLEFDPAKFDGSVHDKLEIWQR